LPEVEDLAMWATNILNSPAGFMSQLRKHVGHLFQSAPRRGARISRRLGMLTDLVGEGIASELGGVFADFLLDAAKSEACYGLREPLHADQVVDRCDKLIASAQSRTRPRPRCRPEGS